MSTDGFAVGDRIRVGDRYPEERKVIGIGSLLLNRPLEFHHPVGAPVIRLRPTAPDSVASEPSRHVIHSDGSDASQADDESTDSDNVGKKKGEKVGKVQLNSIMKFLID